MNFVDIGINLAHDSYDRDREDVVRRALAAGVTRMVVTGDFTARGGITTKVTAEHAAR